MEFAQGLRGMELHEAQAPTESLVAWFQVRTDAALWQHPPRARARAEPSPDRASPPTSMQRISCIASHPVGCSDLPVTARSGELQANEEAGEGVCASGQQSPMRARLRSRGFMLGQARRRIETHAYVDHRLIVAACQQHCSIPSTRVSSAHPEQCCSQCHSRPVLGACGQVSSRICVDLQPGHL